MSCAVPAGSLLQCTFGTIPAPLNVLPMDRTFIGGPAAGNIMDTAAPLINVPSFGVCNAIPIAPTPCVPCTLCWVGFTKVLVGGLPLLDLNAKLICARGGLIQVIVPSQFTVLDNM
jgi:hypothetical protein